MLTSDITYVRRVLYGNDEVCVCSRRMAHRYSSWRPTYGGGYRDKMYGDYYYDDYRPSSAYG